MAMTYLAMHKVFGWTDRPHPICVRPKTMNCLINVSIEIGSAERRACSASCYADIQKTNSGFVSKKRPFALAEGEDSATQSKGAKKRATAAKAKAADKAVIAELKALANGNRLQATGALSSRQRNHSSARGARRRWNMAGGSSRTCARPMPCCCSAR